MRIRGSQYLALVPMLIAAGACASAEEDFMAQPAPGVMADASIAGIVSTANQGQIEQGRIAASKATNASVREFGQRMVTEHTNAQQQLETLLDEVNGSTAGSTTATQLEQNSAQTVQRLNALEGAAFDRTFIDTQIAVHEWLLETLDNTLIPQARNDAFEAHLRTTRTGVASHLEQARSIRRNLGS